MSAAAARRIRLSLGPIPFYWPREKVLAFYDAAKAWPVDTVYLGETVCSRRHELRLDDWLAVGEMLCDAGKEVILSSLELTECEADLRAVRAVVRNGRFVVEANDMGAVHLLSGNAPFVAGPFLNLYNPESLCLMYEMGAKRWVAPVELGADSLRALIDGAPDDMQAEVFAYGRAPLAVSSRCFTARYLNLSKDHCDYRCIEYPDGLLVSTQEDAPFLVLNGVQTQSARILNLVRELDEAAAMGVDFLRISPRVDDTDRVVAIFDAVARGELSGEQALAQIDATHAVPTCQGYWHGQPGMNRAPEDMARSI